MIYDQTSGDNYTIYNADCVHVASELPDESIGFSIHSPPFGDLFVYSDNAADMGNCANDDEFFEQYLHLVKEMFRVTKPGRLAAIHCTDLPTRKSREGYIGLKPFSDRIRQAYEDAGFYYHCRVTVWRDPVVEMQRTKALGLLYKQLKKDGAMSRVGLSDYVIVMRKPGDNLEPITHDPEKVPVELWQQWASPVWMDINQSDVLNVRMARESKDERHLCPLQLDLIERAILLWSNEGDVVFSPFAGIGSEGYVAIQQRRKFLGAELKNSYYNQAVKYLDGVESESANGTLFDQMGCKT